MAEQPLSKNALTTFFFSTRKYSVSTKWLENILLYSWTVFYYGNQTNCHAGLSFRRGERMLVETARRSGLCCTVAATPVLSSHPKVVFWLLNLVKHKLLNLILWGDICWPHKMAGWLYLVSVSCSSAEKPRQRGVVGCSALSAMHMLGQQENELISVLTFTWSVWLHKICCKDETWKRLQRWPHNFARCPCRSLVIYVLR